MAMVIARIKKGVLVHQDFGTFRWLGSNELFLCEKKQRWWECRNKGNGFLSPNYGNGSIFVSTKGSLITPITPMLSTEVLNQNTFEELGAKYETQRKNLEPPNKTT